MTLTYNPNLAKVKVDLYAKYQGQRSNGSAVRAHSDGQTDGRYQFYYLPCFAVDNEAKHATNSLWQMATNSEILSISVTIEKNMATSTLSKYLNARPCVYVLGFWV